MRKEYGELTVPIDAFSRFFIRQDVSFRAKRNVGVPLRFYDTEYLSILDTFQQACANGKAVLEIKTDDFLEITLVRPNVAGGYAVLLLHRTDPEGLMQMYKNRQTKIIRQADRQEHDSIIVSAHMIIALNETEGRPDTYNAVLEEVQGIPRTMINRLFDLILSRSPYTVEMEDGEVQAVSVSTILGHASENVGNAMEDSVIKTMTLIRPGGLQGCDEESAEFKDQTLGVSLTAGRGQTLPLIGRIWRAAQEQDWQECRIKVEMPEQQKSRIVSLERGMDAAEAVFVRAVYVQVTDRIPACCNVIHEQLVEKGVQVMRGEITR